MPRLDLILNNVIAYPTAKGYCGQSTTFCITSSNGKASAPLKTIIHHADPTRDILQTRIDGNVYANGTGSIAITELGAYASHTKFSQAMSGVPVSIPSVDANGKTGDSGVNAIRNSCVCPRPNLHSIRPLLWPDPARVHLDSRG